MEEPVITIDHLTHRFGDKTVYEGLSLEVRRGERVALLGKNGTGKTTLIHILMGFLRPMGGACRIFGEEANAISPLTRQRIALLLEGHVQLGYMDTSQIERYYAAFYPRWRRDVYYELIGKLKVSPRQKINTMSCGQRSQVALGLILAQDADLLVLDDFSMGLDPGYRRLFTDYLRDYVTSEGKTLFVTSHIIQDMERLVDRCAVMDYGRLLVHDTTRHLIDTFRKYTIPGRYGIPMDIPEFYYPEATRDHVVFHSFESSERVAALLRPIGVSPEEITSETLTLEDVFIGLTGKY